MRPNTQGCTEWSCVYHGASNREKAEHLESCPVRTTDANVIHLNGSVLVWATLVCTCSPETAYD
jgi:hypothetical protein